MSQLVPAVFLDRDGTLMEEVGYCSDARDVRVYPGVSEALARLKQAGWKAFLITNQSGIGRGYFTEEQYQAVHAELLRQIGAGLIDAAYYAPEAPGTPSARRKPAPGMVLEAATAHGVDLARSFFIGDKAIDVECGRRAGTRTILVRTGYGAAESCTPDFTAPDFSSAISLVLGAA
jgi:D-glycero-D-manno-heptose 1,7-bisphosphate phosphatase